MPLSLDEFSRAAAPLFEQHGLPADPDTLAKRHKQAEALAHLVRACCYSVGVRKYGYPRKPHPVIIPIYAEKAELC